MPTSRFRTPRRHRSSRVAAVAAAAAWLAMTPAAARADGAAPPGYAAAASAGIAPGVTQTALTRTAPAEHAQLIRIDHGAPVRLEAVMAQPDANGARLETPSAMCARLSCIAALNGDFFGGSATDPAHPDPVHPLGAVVTDCRLVQTPTRPDWAQLTVDRQGHLSAGSLGWRGRVDLPDGTSLHLDGVNVTRPDDATVLYTPDYGASTATARRGFAAGGALQPVVEVVLRRASPFSSRCVGSTTPVDAVARAAGGDAPIPADGFVIAAGGSAIPALESAWRQASGQAGHRWSVRLDTDPEAETSIGVNPVILRNGAPTGQQPPDCPQGCANPQAVLGFDPAGDVVISEVDGRQPGYSEGATLADETALLLAEGMAGGVAFDSGGSAAVVAQGRLLNSPSDVLVGVGRTRVVVHEAAPGDQVLSHVERPVADALLVLPALPPPTPLTLGVARSSPPPPHRAAPPAPRPSAPTRVRLDPRAAVATVRPPRPPRPSPGLLWPIVGGALAGRLGTRATRAWLVRRRGVTPPRP